MEDDLILNIPNRKTIKCLTCKWGLHNFLAEYCVKYELKPRDVYFESADCEKYEPIIEKNVD